MSEALLTHQPCEVCGSSDGATIYDDHTYCFVCEHWEGKNEQLNIPKKTGKRLKIIPLHDMEVKDLRARGITQETCRKYDYYVAQLNKPLQVATYKDDSGDILFQKTRDKDKNFLIHGKRVYRFYGQHLFPQGRKLIITEGEIDCLTVSQVQQNKYPVVSLPFGSTSAEATFKHNLEWLEGFEEVIVMFDMDKYGQKAVGKVSGLLSPHKLKIASLPRKDPNECLLAGHPDEIIQAIWNAKEYKPDGIKNAKDLKDDFFTIPIATAYSFPWCTELQKMTQGIRMGEITMLTAGSGIGKSTMARELAYKLKTGDNLKIGMIMLEENPRKTLRDILSIHLQKPLHLIWENTDKTELAQKFDEVFGDGRFILYDHFGSLESDNLLQKIRYMIVAEGCSFIILDHISIAISGLDESGADERKCIDKLMTRLRSLTEETGAGVIVISHLRKTDNKAVSHEEGGIITLDDLRGSGALKQLSDTIIALERNQQAEESNERNTLKVRVLKCRFTGDTGLAGYIRFNKSKNILEDVLKDEETGVQDKDNKYGF